MSATPEIERLLIELEAIRGDPAAAKRLRIKLRELGHVGGSRTRAGPPVDKPKYIKGQKPENLWARAICGRLQTDLAAAVPDGVNLRVSESRMLPYAQPVLECEDCEGTTRWIATKPPSFAADIVLELHTPDGRWTPAVVVECKLGSFDTHNILAYAAKARSHRSVFPAMRYGALIGRWSGGVTGKLARHGESFDFIVTWADENPTDAAWADFVSILKQELEASACLRGIAVARKEGKRNPRWIHRRLVSG